jgi:hypothetical protein
VCHVDEATTETWIIGDAWRVALSPSRPIYRHVETLKTTSKYFYKALIALDQGSCSHSFLLLAPYCHSFVAFLGLVAMANMSSGRNNPQITRLFHIPGHDPAGSHKSHSKPLSSLCTIDLTVNHSLLYLCTVGKAFTCCSVAAFI